MDMSSRYVDEIHMNYGTNTFWLCHSRNSIPGRSLAFSGTERMSRFEAHSRIS